MIEPITIFTPPVIEACNCTGPMDVMRFAAEHGLMVYEYPEHVKFVIVIFVVGFIIGITATKLFEFTYRYGKRSTEDKRKSD